MEESGRIVNADKEDGSHPLALWSIGRYSQTWMAERVTSANQPLEVTPPVPICTFPLSFSCFHQNKYDIAHCLEHSLKCWNS